MSTVSTSTEKKKGKLTEKDLEPPYLILHQDDILKYFPTDKLVKLLSSQLGKNITTMRKEKLKGYLTQMAQKDNIDNVIDSIRKEVTNNKERGFENEEDDKNVFSPSKEEKHEAEQTQEAIEAKHKKELKKQADIEQMNEEKKRAMEKKDMKHEEEKIDKDNQERLQKGRKQYLDHEAKEKYVKFIKERDRDRKLEHASGISQKERLELTQEKYAQEGGTKNLQALESEQEKHKTEKMLHTVKQPHIAEKDAQRKHMKSSDLDSVFAKIHNKGVKVDKNEYKRGNPDEMFKQFLKKKNAKWNLH